MNKVTPKDGIAIVGYSHRLPGEERGDFWDLLLRGEDLVTEVAGDRWAKETYLHPNKSEPGRAYTFASGSVGDIFGFDAAFFGISPREAAQMDPQQRLLLELSWEAFENAGIKPSAWRGSDAGVFVGISTTDNVYLSVDDLAAIDSTSATGNTNSVTANRLSYLYDLRGPSMSLDTACSSSLVAFHQACQAIRGGDSGAAIVAGVSLHLHPMGFINFSKTSMLSSRGRCTPFDEAGDGYVRSEGAGVILLKSLSKAIEEGDRILAVVAASGVNCDGKTSSLTVPSSEVQSKLLEEVYKKAGIRPEEVSYLEAHGTGTQVGDPIETSALAEVLGKSRAPGSPLPIGSIKSNIGHLEAASGMAGLVKALLVLKHRVIPPTIHLKKVNPRIPLKEWGLDVPVEATALPAKGRLVVGVNSFGFGGANAHVILESPVAKKEPRASKAKLTEDSVPSPLFLSAKSEEALKAVAKEYVSFLKKDANLSVYDLAQAVTSRREWLPHRLAVTAETAYGVSAALENWLLCGTDESVVEGRSLEASGNPVFFFSGNGSQYAGMGRQLLSESKVFRDAVSEVDTLFARYADYSLKQALEDPEKESMLRLTEVAQPTLFAIQVGLVRLLQAYGITPGAVIGHSVGEVAAAWASGALSLEQAVHVIHQRSLQQGKTKGSGEMTAVALGAEELEELLQQIDPKIRPCVAGINSPHGCTVAGIPDGLLAFETRLVTQGIRYKRLDLDYAFHSPSMDPIRPSLLDDLRDLVPANGEIPFHSTVTGKKLPGKELGPHYWWRNVRDPVLFAEALEGLIRDGNSIFLEIGPHPVLRTYVKECLQGAGVEGVVASLMTRTNGTFSHFLRGVLEIIQSGISGGRDAFFKHPPVHRIDLPGYPWQKVRFETPHTAESYGLSGRRRDHPLLGYRLKEGSFTWENHLDTTLYPYLADHKVGGAVVFPAAGFVEIAMAAGSHRFGSSSVDLEDLEIHAPLLLEEKKSKTIRVSLDEQESRLTIKSRERLSDDPWMTHVTGRVLLSPSSESCVLENQGAEVPKLQVGLSAEELYKSAARLGLDYGEAFRPVQGILLADRKIEGRLVTPDSLREETRRYLLHPTYLDGGLQALLGLIAVDPSESQQRKAFLPIRFDRLRLHRPQESCASLEATVTRLTRRGILADLCLKNAKGELVASVSGVRFKGAKLIVSAGDQARFLTTTLVPRPLPACRAIEELSLSNLRLLIEESLPKVQGSEHWVRYAGEAEPLLELLCSLFAKETFLAMTKGRSPFSLDQLVKTGFVQESLQTQAHALLVGLVQEGFLRKREDGHYSWINRPEDPSPQAVWLTLIEEHPKISELIRVTGRIGIHLAKILSGQRDDTEILPRSWREDSPLMVPGSRMQIHELMSLVLGRLLSVVREGVRPRILWILGNSNHGEKILGSWMAAGHSDVTIAVPTAQARRDLAARLAGYPNVDIHVFEGREVPAEQALGGRFDLVMVASGMTGMSNREGLEGLKQLLLPGGTLVFAEQAPNRLDDFLFGFVPDWWVIEDDRLESPRRRPADWKSRLEEAGFASSDVVMTQGMGGSLFLILAAAGDVAAKESNDSEKASSWLILFDDEPSATVALEIQDRLEHLNQCSEIASIMDEEGWRKLLASTRTTKSKLMVVTGMQQDDGNVEMLMTSLKTRLGVLNSVLKANEESKSPAAVMVLSTGFFAGDPLLGDQGNVAATIEGGALLGYLRVARNEFTAANLRLLDVRDEPWNKAAEAVVAEMMVDSVEDEVLLGSFGRKVPRTRGLSSMTQACRTDELCYLDFSQPGSFSHLQWHAGPRVAPGQGELEIEVRAAGLNFRDVMYAMGLLPDEALESGFAGQTVGMELSGVVTRTGPGVTDLKSGDEVIAFAPKAFSTHALTKAEAVMKKPGAWSFEAAATIPTAFFTVYYALVELARVRAGERLLIHGAAGGVGIAAIQLARHLGLEIFATAGSEEKRDFIRMLGVDHVLDSRSLRFADEIMVMTGGVGVDVILNSLAGEAIVKNLKILRPFGRFLELGKRDFYENNRLGLRPFRNNITYHGIDADQLMAVNPALTGELFAKITALFAEGVLHPLPHTVFDSSEIAEAFRYMQHSKQVGKVIVTSPGHTAGKVIPASRPGPLSLREDATYLVTGGTSGFGLQTAQWLARCGARSLVLASRRGILNDEGRGIVSGLTSSGVNVEIVSCDVGSRDSLSQVLDRIRSTMPPLRGVVHSAMVIEDGLLMNLSESQLEKVLRPKISGAMLLDELTRRDRLDLFVLYSSATSVFGNPGQGAYVAANLALEALASRRASESLPSTCVAWGPIGDAGYLARNQQIKNALVSRMGGRALDSEEALETLGSLITQGVVNVAWLDLDWEKLAKFLPSVESPRFEAFRHELEEQSAHGGEVRSIREQFAGLNQDQAIELLQEHLAQSIAGILRMDAAQLDHRKSLFDVGMDSLMAVELAATLEESLSIKLPMMILSEGPTLQKLAQRIAGMILNDASHESSGDTLQETVQVLAAQHGAEELSEEDLTEIATSLSRSSA